MEHIELKYCTLPHLNLLTCLIYYIVNVNKLMAWCILSAKMLDLADSNIISESFVSGGQK